MAVEMLSEEVCPPSPLASAIIVKNTFIDMEDDALESDPRRSTSEPPSCRHRDQPRSPDFFGAQRGKLASDISGSTTSGSPRESGSDLASEDRSLGSQQASPDATPATPGLNPNAPVWSPSWSPASPVAAAPCMPGSPTCPPAAQPQGPVYFQMPPSSPAQAFAHVAPAPPPPPPPPPAEQYSPNSLQQQHRLNANAKAWQPTFPALPPAHDHGHRGAAPPAVPPPPAAVPQGHSALAAIPNRFRGQFETLLESAKQALKRSDGVTGVEISPGSGSWGRGMKVVAWMRRQESGGRARDQVLKYAKDALMRSAAQSESVYVIGYNNRPFTMTENGFAAQLGGMFDENKACWDMFTKGHCRQRDCHRQHPACLLPIHVEIHNDYTG